MKLLILASLCVLTATVQMNAQTAAQLAQIWDREHITDMAPSNVRHKNLKAYIERLSLLGVDTKRVGRSTLKKDIFQLQFGHGPLKVFMWSQMHGDEPTATSALIDLFAILRANRKDGWAEVISDKITLRAVPMLNPDGADVYQRRNAKGIDINRDAVERKTREAQLLKNLREKWKPEIGFNLHNQNELTTVGQTDKQASISFMVVYGDAAKTTSPGHERNLRVTSAMIAALRQFIPDNIAKYDDEYTPTAFGDNFSAWGTPTILIETGALADKPESYLVKMNFIALVTALRSIADGSELTADTSLYNSLPENTRGRIFDFVFRNATFIDRKKPGDMMTGDLALNSDRHREEVNAATVVKSIGKPVPQTGLEEYDAGGFYATGRLLPLAVDSFGEIMFYRKDRKIDWAASDLEKQFPPDAIFSMGEWIKGEGVVPKK